MMDLTNTISEQNLRKAIVGEHNAFLKFLRYRNVADVVGPHEVAELYRATQLLRGGHPKIDQLFKDLLSEQVISAMNRATGSTAVPYDAAVFAPGAMYYMPPSVEFTQEDVDRYNGYATMARNEGFDELADWFEKLALAERSQIPGQAPRPQDEDSHPGISFVPN